MLGQGYILSVYGEVMHLFCVFKMIEHKKDKIAIIDYLEIWRIT